MMLYAIPRKIVGKIPDTDPVTIEENGEVAMVYFGYIAGCLSGGGIAVGKWRILVSDSV